MFGFERNFYPMDCVKWMETHWHFSIYTSVLYVLFIHGLRAFMVKRQALNLKVSLFVWNVALAVFSVAGTVRMIPELVHTFVKRGMEGTVCDPSFIFSNDLTKFWTWAFIVSKVVELGDTVFIVLRKRPLTFIHWFHHAMTLVSTSYSYAFTFAAGRWVICMNYFIHAVMYSYFACKSLQINLSRTIAKNITRLQLIQFVVGFVMASRTVVALQAGVSCSSTLANALFCATVYFINVCMFGHFFKKAYGTKQTKLV